MKHKLLGAICLLWTATQLNAQNQDYVLNFINQNTNQITALSQGGAYYVGNKKTETEIHGSFFLKDTWQNAIVLSTDGQRAKCQARYRIYDEEMQVLINDEVQAFVMDKIKAIALENQIFVPSDFFDGTNYQKGYFELLAEGELNFLIHREATLQKGHYNAALHTGDNFDKIVILEDFYYQDSNRIARKLKKSKKTILQLMNNYAKEVETYADENSFSFKKKQDLIQIFNFYNTLKARQINE